MTGIPLAGRYTFQAETLKALEKHLDGVLLPESADLPAFLIEFQSYFDPLIYERILWQRSARRLEQPQQALQAVVIFTDSSYDPKKDVWHPFAHSENKVLRAVYLSDMLLTLPETHPLRALFLPLLHQDVEALRQEVAAAYQHLRQVDLPEDKELLLREVFFSWLEQAFQELSLEDIQMMLRIPTTPLEETRAYRDILERGMKKGMEKGEASRSRKIAKQLLEEKCDPAWIAKVTDLTLAEVQALQQENL